MIYILLIKYVDIMSGSKISRKKKDEKGEKYYNYYAKDYSIRNWESS
jgi:hypothetical protein